MSKHNYEPPDFLKGAEPFMPKGAPDDPAQKSTSEDPGLVSEFGGFAGGKTKIQRAKMHDLPKSDLKMDY